MAPTLRRSTERLRALALVCLLVSGLPSTLRAQQAPATLPDSLPAGTPVRRLTLEEARQLALENNQALALARLNVAERGHAATAARKDYLPKIIGVDDYFHFNDNLGSVVTFQRGRLGILNPGSSLVNVNVLNEDSNLATVFVAQPITKLIAVNAEVQIARADEGAAKAQLDKGTRDVLSGVTQAYQGLLGAQRILAALELQVKVLEQLSAVQPAPQLRVGLLQARQGLVQVRSQVRELTQTLLDLLNLPSCTVLELVDPVPAELQVRCEDEAAKLALSCSPEVREAEQEIAKAEAALKVAKMAYVPDVNVIGGYANQTIASYIQPNIGYLGLAGSYTFWEWGKKRDIKRQREMDIALAHQHVRVVSDKVQLDARKAYSEYEQARDQLRLGGEMVQARKEAEKSLAGSAAFQAKADTSKAELEYMKAEITYRVAHAKLAALVCAP
jgi:outer membrane protein TolC